MKARRFVVGDRVMVDSKSVETEEIDGMRGRVSRVDGDIATVECRAWIESHVLRVPLVELVRISSDA
ncbi:hypothetical protein [Caballeronia sp. LZ032]|uniref:hypothetical protein n=1 Tax=Caballeronia sp. LZ032 TaxID=3038565 RepID=UPI00285F9A6E|nr:hypothetical protein [Caballeronia sp. LZ032]MDR5883584.1 hypothetical protein [Caballeronia sp. LZ032]